MQSFEALTYGGSALMILMSETIPDSAQRGAESKQSGDTAQRKLFKPLFLIKKDKKVFIYLEKMYLCCNKSRVRFVYNKIKLLLSFAQVAFCKHLYTKYLSVFCDFRVFY